MAKRDKLEAQIETQVMLVKLMLATIIVTMYLIYISIFMFKMFNVQNGIEYSFMLAGIVLAGQAIWLRNMWMNKERFEKELRDLENQ